MQIRTTSPAAWLALALVTGCADWPRFGNLPQHEGMVPASVDPGSLVVLDWSTAQEPPGDNDLPTLPDVPALAHPEGTGTVLRGTLDGLGWSDAAEPDALTAPDCPGASGTRSALAEGDYVGDVDFVVVDVPVGSTLCAAAAVEAPGGALLGWDLVPFAADACGIPIAPGRDEAGEPVGVDSGGEADGWGIVAAHDRYAVLFAGYHPNDPALAVDYVLGVSVVPSAPNGRPGQCPSLPETEGSR